MACIHVVMTLYGGKRTRYDQVGLRWSERLVRMSAGEATTLTLMYQCSVALEIRVVTNEAKSELLWQGSSCMLMIDLYLTDTPREVLNRTLVVIAGKIILVVLGNGGTIAP